jgi:hypothetical protein
MARSATAVKSARRARSVAKGLREWVSPVKRDVAHRPSVTLAIQADTVPGAAAAKEQSVPIARIVPVAAKEQIARIVPVAAREQSVQIARIVLAAAKEQIARIVPAAAKEQSGPHAPERKGRALDAVVIALKELRAQPSPIAAAVRQVAKADLRATFGVAVARSSRVGWRVVGKLWDEELGYFSVSSRSVPE